MGIRAVEMAIWQRQGDWSVILHTDRGSQGGFNRSSQHLLSPGQAHDAPEGREPLRKLGEQEHPLHLLMDSAYEGNETRQLALDLGFVKGAPLITRIDPLEYDREIHKRRKEVEHLFRRLKGFRRIFSRFEKLDVIFIGFVSFALIVDTVVLTGPNPRLRHYVQDRLEGKVHDADGREIAGPRQAPFKGEINHIVMTVNGLMAGRLNRLPTGYRSTFRMTNPCVSLTKPYPAFYIQGRGALKGKLVSCLCTGRALHPPRARAQAKAWVS